MRHAPWRPPPMRPSGTRTRSPGWGPSKLLWLWLGQGSGQPFDRKVDGAAVVPVETGDVVCEALEGACRGDHRFGLPPNHERPALRSPNGSDKGEPARVRDASQGKTLAAARGYTTEFRSHRVQM